jgi:hypothetical protein
VVEAECGGDAGFEALEDVGAASFWLGPLWGANEWEFHGSKQGLARAFLQGEGEIAAGSYPSHSISSRRVLLRGVVYPFSQLETAYIDRPIAIAKLRYVILRAILRDRTASINVFGNDGRTKPPCDRDSSPKLFLSKRSGAQHAMNKFPTLLQGCEARATLGNLPRRWRCSQPQAQTGYALSRAAHSAANSGVRSYRLAPLRSG